MSPEGEHDDPYLDCRDRRDRIERARAERAGTLDPDKDHGDRRGTGQPEYRHGGAAHDDSRRRREDRRAHHRVPPEERRLQEGRGPDERQRRGGEELPQDEAAHHGRRCEDHRTERVGGPAGRGGASRLPRPARHPAVAGYTLIDVIFAVALTGTLAAMALPETM